MKTLQIKLYLYQQKSSLLYEASRISSVPPLGREVFTAIKCSALNVRLILD